MQKSSHSAKAMRDKKVKTDNRVVILSEAKDLEILQSLMLLQDDMLRMPVLRFGF